MADKYIFLKHFKNLFKLKSVTIYLRMLLNPLLCIFFKVFKQLGLCFIWHLLDFFDCSISCFNLLLKRLTMAFFCILIEDVLVCFLTFSKMLYEERKHSIREEGTFCLFAVLVHYFSYCCKVYWSIRCHGSGIILLMLMAQNNWNCWRQKLKKLFFWHDFSLNSECLLRKLINHFKQILLLRIVSLGIILKTFADIQI